MSPTALSPVLASILLTELLGEFTTVLRDLTGVNIVTSEAHSGPPVLNHDDNTATSGSWMTVVEVFFGILTRPALRRGSFTSVAALQTAIGTYMDPDTRLAKATRLKLANTHETSVTRPEVVHDEAQRGRELVEASGRDNPNSPSRDAVTPESKVAKNFLPAVVRTTPRRLGLSG